MKDFEVSFCRECGDEIISRRLSVFWKWMCMTSCKDHCWVSLDQDRLTDKYIKCLEKKNFLVSTDHSDYIMVKPHGLYKQDEGEYLVCLCPEVHFESIVGD